MQSFALESVEVELREESKWSSKIKLFKMKSKIVIFFLCAFMAEKTVANGCPSQTTVSAFVVNRFIQCLPFLVLIVLKT